MYATQKVYKDLGFESEIIKYKQEITYKDPFIIRLKILVRYILFLRTNVVITFLKKLRIKNFKKHAKKYYSESKKYVDPLNIDATFHKSYAFLSVGSDQIWGWFNYNIADLIFLQFTPKEKRITFSPSFGSAIIAEKYSKIYAQGLEGFNNISVRESSGTTIIKEFTNKEATVLCDPTMCVSKADWLTFATSHKKKPTKKYILTYFLGEKSPKVVSLIAELSKEYEIIALNSFNAPKYYAITPSEWVDYINDASLFLTDSFHGVVFSTVLQTPFVVYSRVGGESMQTRISHILEKFNMENRFEISENTASLFIIDFLKTEEIIAIEKLKVYAFLEESIR
ncbi:hypothetical protein GCM10007963_30670 [Lutibacter litoralis]|nr:hypothetical protein GCM10007963_30670 [Lutibacter litoralis]